MIKIYEIKETKKLPDCEVEITAEITTESLEGYKIKALNKIKEVAELPGFRKGHVPEAKLKEKFGEMGILEDAGEMAINDCAAEILIESKINFLGRPNIAISKIAIGSPIEFKIKVTVMPEVKLPDYKKIAKKENAIEEKVEEVTDKQVEETIEQIRKMYHSQTKSQSDVAGAHVHSADCKHDVEELPLPEVNDEFIKKLGDFKDVTGFKAQLKINIAKEKEVHAKDKKRGKMLDKLVDETKIEMPKVIIESELDKMEGQFKDDISKMGLQPEEYLKHIKKTWEELRKEWHPDAEKRAKTQLILQKISLEEKIEPKKEDVEKEIKKLLELYKTADPERVKAYVEMILVNEAVIKFLEELK